MVALGNVVGFSAILIRQLKHEDSAIEIDLSKESWIGETAIRINN